MKALKCDVCGGYFDSIRTCNMIVSGKTKPNKLQIYYRDNNANTRDKCYYDICPDCYNAIKKALDDRRKITVDVNDDDLK